MTKVGITGGIGSGKSTIANILRAFGYPVYSADERGRWLTDNHPEVIHAIKNLFGDAIYTKSNQLNRARVAGIVFKDASLLAQLNRIIHPAVAADFNAWCAQQPTKLLFKEAAIMFESSANKGLDKVMCISAPEETRIKRVMQRDNASEAQVAARIHNQMADTERQKLSDFVIFNDGRQFVLPQLQTCLQQLGGTSGRQK